ncbi:hypothetical protein [Streptomyces lincolnensis]|uniref:hypothetical protein n=1 Tax=Streptomyces lincolnensis TaxID=1915 RepID=UPI0037CD78E9
MGGSMALRMAADRPGLLTGAAAVSGELPTGAAEVRPTGPVPVMIVYGADDPVRARRGPHLAGLDHHPAEGLRAHQYGAGGDEYAESR